MSLRNSTLAPAKAEDMTFASAAAMAPEQRPVALNYALRNPLDPEAASVNSSNASSQDLFDRSTSSESSREQLDDIIDRMFDDQQRQYHKSEKVGLGYTIPSYAWAAACAFVAAAGDGLSLYKAGNTSMSLLIFALGVAFTASLELSGPSAAINMQEIFNAIFKGKCPDDLLDENNQPPNLSTTQISLLALANITIGMWGIASDMFQAYIFTKMLGINYKIDETPHAKEAWLTFAGLIAIGAGATRVFTELAETAKCSIKAANFKAYLAKLLADPTPTPIKIAAFSVGGSLAGIKSAHDAFSSFFVIQPCLGINSLGGTIALGSACSTEVLTSLTFTGDAMIRQSLDFGNAASRILKKEQSLEISKVLAMLTSLGLALFLAIIKRKLNESMYLQFNPKYANLAPGESPSLLYVLVSWIVVVAEAGLVLASLNPDMAKAFSKLADIFNNYYERFTMSSTQGDYPVAQSLNADQDVELALPKGALPRFGVFGHPASAAAPTTEASSLLSGSPAPSYST